MRIITLTSKPISNLNKSVSQLIFTDEANDIEEFEYMLSIRFYDLIILDAKIIKSYKKILQSLKIINQKYSDKIKYNLLIINAEEPFKKEITNKINTIYKNILNYYSFEEESEIENKIIKIFYAPSKNIELIETELKSKMVKIRINGKVSAFSLKIKKDVLLLTYFLRHYNEVISMENILSGITKEPELTNVAIIESSISSLRKIMINTFGEKRIYVNKGLGYQFV